MDDKYNRYQDCFHYLEKLPKKEIFILLSKLYRNITKSRIGDKYIQADTYTEDYYNGIIKEIICVGKPQMYGDLITLSRIKHSGVIKYYNFTVRTNGRIDDVDIELLWGAIRKYKISKLEL